MSATAENVYNIDQSQNIRRRSHLKKIDHVSYAVESGSIEKWAWFPIEVLLADKVDNIRKPYWDYEAKRLQQPHPSPDSAHS